MRSGRVCNPHSGCLCFMMRHKPAAMASPSWRMGRSASPMPLWLWPTPLACVNPHAVLFQLQLKWNLLWIPSTFSTSTGSSLFPFHAQHSLLLFTPSVCKCRGDFYTPSQSFWKSLNFFFLWIPEYLLHSLSVFHLALKHLCGFIIGFHVKFVSKHDTISY